MALWGITDADESKPKWLNDDDKKQVFANASGWVAEPALSGNSNADATPEILVAVKQLSTDIAAADITEIEFITTSVSANTAAAFSVRVRFNEPVDVDTSGGTPYLTVTNDGSGGGSNFNLDYASGTGTNELVFTATWTTEFLENDVLSIGANAITLNSGTITDATGDADTSTTTNSADIGTAAGTIAVAA